MTEVVYSSGGEKLVLYVMRKRFQGAGTYLRWHVVRFAGAERSASSLVGSPTMVLEQSATTVVLETRLRFAGDISL